MYEVIEKIPPEAWLALVGVLIGSILAILGSWLTNRSNQKNLKLQLANEKQQRYEQTLQDKLEELYVLIGNWNHAFVGNSMLLFPVMRGEIDYNEYLDLLLKNDYSSKYDFNRIEMIIGIYGKDLKEAYANTLAARDRVNKISGEHKAAYKRGESGLDFIKPFSEAHLNFQASVTELKNEISELTVRNVIN